MLFASIVEEIQCMIENTDYTLIVSYLDEDADEVEQAVLLCRERKPLGLLFLGGNPEYFHRKVLTDRLELYSYQIPAFHK